MTHVFPCDRYDRLITHRRWARWIVGMMTFVLLLCGTPVFAALCGPGPGWVRQCAGGVDTVIHTSSVLDVWIMTPQGMVNLPNLSLTGLTEIHRGDPVLPFEQLAYIPITLERHLSANIPGVGQISFDGTGTGRITEQSRGSAFATAFLDISLELVLNGRTLHTEAPVHLTADRLLTGVPLDLPPFAPPPSQSCDPDPANPTIAVVFCGEAPFHLLDGDGNVVATVHSARFIVSPVPEPASFGLLFVGLAGLLGGRRLWRRRG